MTSPVVLDGRLTKEKLVELVQLGAEHAELDFKSTLDLSDAAHRLGLVKDIIAMANAGGGYIVVGAYDDGTPATDQEQPKGQGFDSADLAQLVARYVAASPVVTSQTHTLEARTHILIFVAPPSDSLPLLVSKPGEFEVEGRKKTVLQQGVLYIREGTRTVTATESHWAQLLSRYRASIIAEARESTDLLIRELVSSMGDAHSGPTPLPPLALDMDELAFGQAIEPYLDTDDGQRRLTRFVRSLRSTASIDNGTDAERLKALDRITGALAQAVLADAKSSFARLIQVLHELYEESVGQFQGDYAPMRQARYWLDIAIRVFCVGSVAVRERAWWAIEPLTNRVGSSYYPVWLRHAITHASRAGLLSGRHKEASMMLVRAHELAVEHPLLRPDLHSVVELEDTGNAPANDSLLNSLAQWDFAWCAVSLATHPDESWDSKLFYPSCAALYQQRTQPIITRLATIKDVRGETLPDLTDEAWAVALGRTLEVAVEQSHQYGSWWDGARADPAVEAFIQGAQQ